MENIIRKYIRKRINLLFENVQLADKVYFTPKKLSPKVREVIISRITNGDNFTKIITDIYYAYLVQGARMGKWALSTIDGKDDDDFDELKDMPEDDVLQLEKWKEIKALYQQLKDYNKNIFPIKGLDIYNTQDIWSVIRSLEQRGKILEMFKKLPSVAMRNMRDDIRQERDGTEMNDYRNDLDYFLAHFSLLGNKDEELQKKVWQKMFKTNTTLKDLMRFVDDKESFLGGQDFTKEQIHQMMKEGEDIEITYENENAMIVDVYSAYAIKKIGCNSVWCFTYGSAFDIASRQWSQYSTNGTVHVIIDFREKSDSQDFMHILIKPLTDEDDNFIEYTEDNEDDIPLYNMANENRDYPHMVLNHIFGDNYKKIIIDYLNFGY